MRWLWVLCLPLMAFTPIMNEHPTQADVDDELKQIYQQAQSLQYRKFDSTPNLTDLQDGQMVLISSITKNGGYSKFCYRDNQEIYTLNGTSITIRR